MMIITMMTIMQVVVVMTRTCRTNFHNNNSDVVHDGRMVGKSVIMGTVYVAMR